MASSISAAWTNLHALLVADPRLAGVQITFGPPDVYEEQEVVAPFNIADADEEAAALGAQRREEVFVIEVGVKAHDPAGTAESVAARGLAIADVVRSVVHGTTDGRTLRGAVRSAQVGGQPFSYFGPFVDSNGAPGPGWVITLVLPIQCHARIT